MSKLQHSWLPCSSHGNCGCCHHQVLCCPIWFSMPLTCSIYKPTHSDAAPTVALVGVGALSVQQQRL